MSLLGSTTRRAFLSSADRRPAWQEPPKPPTVIAKAVVLLAVVVLAVLPFWVVLSTSLSPDTQVNRDNGYTLWPQVFSLHAFGAIMQGGLLQHAMLVSVWLVVIATTVSMLFTTMLAYALSRPRVVGGKPVLLMCLFAFVFPPGMIPTYLVVSNLHMVDTYWSLAVPVLVSVFNMVIMRGFFQGLPAELYDAARLDGCGELRTLFQVVLPLSRPIIAVTAFFYGVSYWNDYFRGLLYISNTDRWPLGTLLYLLVTQGANPDANGSSSEALHTLPSNSEAMATVVVAVLPIVIVYPFLQRFFTKGVLTGAVKS
jgi:putative aldouronate transport system permease protein